MSKINVKEFILEVLNEVMDKSYIISQVMRFKKGNKCLIPPDLYNEFVEWIENLGWTLKTPRGSFTSYYCKGTQVLKV